MASGLLSSEFSTPSDYGHSHRSPSCSSRDRASPYQVGMGPLHTMPTCCCPTSMPRSYSDFYTYTYSHANRTQTCSDYHPTLCHNTHSHPHSHSHSLSHSLSHSHRSGRHPHVWEVKPVQTSSEPSVQNLSFDREDEATIDPAPRPDPNSGKMISISLTTSSSRPILLSPSASSPTTSLPRTVGIRHNHSRLYPNARTHPGDVRSTLRDDRDYEYDGDTEKEWGGEDSDTSDDDHVTDNADDANEEPFKCSGLPDHVPSSMYGNTRVQDLLDNVNQILQHIVDARERGGDVPMESTRQVRELPPIPVFDPAFRHMPDIRTRDFGVAEPTHSGSNDPSTNFREECLIACQGELTVGYDGTFGQNGTYTRPTKTKPAGPRNARTPGLARIHTMPETERHAPAIRGERQQSQSRFYIFNTDDDEYDRYDTHRSSYDRLAGVASIDKLFAVFDSEVDVVDGKAKRERHRDRKHCRQPIITFRVANPDYPVSPSISSVNLQAETWSCDGPDLQRRSSTGSDVIQREDANAGKIPPSSSLESSENLVSLGEHSGVSSRTSRYGGEGDCTGERNANGQKTRLIILDVDREVWTDRRGVDYERSDESLEGQDEGLKSTRLHGVIAKAKRLFTARAKDGPEEASGSQKDSAKHYPVSGRNTIHSMIPTWSLLRPHPTLPDNGVCSEWRQGVDDGHHDTDWTKCGHTHCYQISRHPLNVDWSHQQPTEAHGEICSATNCSTRNTVSLLTVTPPCIDHRRKNDGGIKPDSGVPSFEPTYGQAESETQLNVSPKRRRSRLLSLPIELGEGLKKKSRRSSNASASATCGGAQEDEWDAGLPPHRQARGYKEKVRFGGSLRSGSGSY